MDLADARTALDRVGAEVEKRIVGQEAVVEQLLACLLCDGNALLEGTPGLGKTLLVRTLADATDLEFSRIQNTPDLMPSDVIGTEIVREREDGQAFVFQEGPVFANVVLADEINRATPKTQSALLEAMQEEQVTAGGETRGLPKPFFLLATQNPLEQEGSLHPEESLYMDGRLWNAEDALRYARTNGELAHETERTRVYDANTTTQTLTPDGELVETACLVYETDYEGSTYTIETKTGRSIRVSDNHPFLVNRDGVFQWAEARDLDENDFLVSPRRLDLPERSFASHGEAFGRLASGGEYEVVRRGRVLRLERRLSDGESLARDEIDALRIAAGLSKKGLATRTDASYDQVLNFLDGAENGLGEQLQAAIRDEGTVVGDHVEAYTTHRIDDAFTLSDAGFFVGFLLAEGSVSETTISVSQKNLPELLDRWVAIAERIGLDVKTRDRPTGREATISSKPFVDYLDERFHLTTPERLLSAPKPFRDELLEVFLLTESDYDADRRRITFSQKDRTLTNLVAHLLLDVGIIPWVYYRGDQHELKIQGEDIERYLERFEWRGTPPDRDTFDSAHRTTPVPREAVARLVDILGMKYDGELAQRSWYNSYRMLQTRRNRMATSYLEEFLDDVERTLDRRRSIDIEHAAHEDLDEAAKLCGLSMTDIVADTTLSKHRVWQAYQSKERPEEAADYVIGEYVDRMAEAEELAAHLRELVDGDVFYDRITSIDEDRYAGPVIGLSVPDHHNYIGGLGGCGISHNTYPLPEAQADRFLLKIRVEFPSFEEEREIVDRYTGEGGSIGVERVLSRDELREIQRLTRQVPIADDLRDEAISIVRRTREAETIEYGASPRASMALVLAAKARALLRDRTHVSEDDLAAMAPPVLRHRIAVDFRAEREGTTPDDAIADLR